MVRRAEQRGTGGPAGGGRFSALGARWGEPRGQKGAPPKVKPGGARRGKMAPLHKFNPVRLGYIRDQAAMRFRRDAKRLDSMKGLRMLDIGCGGGILTEPLARLGAEMVGVDPSATNIEAAKEHA